jgi:hypothetical protein
MLALLAAQFAKPAIRYGVIAGVLMLVIGSIWWHGYNKGKSVIQSRWDNSIALASAHAVQESVKASAMESAVVKANDQAERVIEAKAEIIKKEVVRYAKKDPKPLRAATIAIYDKLVSLPNEAGRSLPSTDSSAGASEVPRAGLAAQAVAGIQDENGNAVELTTEELAQAAVDFAEKYALIKNAYKGLSDWNDGRERLELERLNHEIN